MTNRELINHLMNFPMDHEVRILHYEPEQYDALDRCIGGGEMCNPKIATVRDNSTGPTDSDYKGIMISSEDGENWWQDERKI